jgi:hypothetical protein
VSQRASGSAQGPLPPSTSAALRSWLDAERRAHVAAGVAGYSTAEDRQLLHEACEEARRRGVHVEQLIILVKQLWATLPSRAAGAAGSAGRGEDWRGREREALEGIVRVCIEEFYAPVCGADGRQDSTASTDGASLRGRPTDGTSTAA